MNVPSDPEKKRLPIFVDDVDKVVEFTDTCVQHPGLLGPQDAALAQSPLLTDVVDRLIEFVDTPPSNVASPMVPKERLPILIDRVDKVVELSDQPAPSEALSLTR